MQDYSEIKLRFEGMDFAQAERYRTIIHKLIVCGALDVNTGQTIISWKDKIMTNVRVNLTLIPEVLK